MYDNGVWVGFLGLMLIVAILGVMFFVIDFLLKVLGGVRKFWGLVNFVLVVGLGLMVAVSKAVERGRRSVLSGVSLF